MKRPMLLGLLVVAALLTASLASPRSAEAHHGVWFEYVVGDYPGGIAEVGVWTHPGAWCSIRYVTPAGTASRAQGLHTKRADRDGWVDWWWYIGTSTRSGWGTVTVSCDNRTRSAWIYIY
jgi:hypothetical protein